jgi:hypothetical protein
MLGGRENAPEGVMKSMTAIRALALSALFVTAASATPSPGTSNAVFGWQGATGWLPLEIRSDHHAYFKIKVNGHEAVAMLDPNIPHTAVDAAFAQSIGLKASDALELGLPRLSIQGLQPAISDLAPLKTALRHPVDVLVGADALSDVVADIDLLGHRLSLADEAGYSVPEIARYTHLEHDGDAWLAPVSIDGGHAAPFALDFMTADAVQIGPDYARRLGLQPQAGPALVSDDGATPSQRAALSQMKFAGIVSTNVVADVPQQLPPAYANAAQGALGVGLLRNYRVILDLKHERLYTLLIDQSGSNLNLFTQLQANTPGNGTPNFGSKPAGF